VRDYSVFETGVAHDYFSEGANHHAANEVVFNKVAAKSYRPMNALLKQMLVDNPEFKVSLSISGVFLEQAEAWAPDVIDSFKDLVATGRVEIVAETYYHSLAFFYSDTEFERQVELHRDKIRELFGVETTAFRNTELSYNDRLAKWADDKGFKAIIRRLG
jgi:alpha-amylase